jgi:ubiquinone/menaquinone biosynthesis C-methylase UbiE
MLHRIFSIKLTQENFSKVVRFYDFWGKLTERKAINKAVKISGLLQKVKVLDIGAGTGQLFERIIRINKEGFNSGVDLSFQMISHAMEKLKSSSTNYSLTLGNAYRLPYKDSSFDFVFSSYVFDLLPEDDFIHVLSEFRRVMKNNASGLIITMSMGDKWYNKFWYLLSKYFPSLLTNCRPVEITDSLTKMKFEITNRENISQNTFPSEIIKFRK